MTPTTSSTNASGLLTIWAGGTSTAKYPLCQLESAGEDYRRYTFHKGQRRYEGIVTADGLTELLDRHRDRGNRVEGL